MASWIGDTQVRHRGTMGGSLANNDPSACYPAAVLALGATIHTDQRSITADDFFQGMFTTALEPGELITAIEFPIPEKSNYEKFRNPASRYAMVGVFVAKGPAGVRVAITGAGQGGVFRHKEMEAGAGARTGRADAIKDIKTLAGRPERRHPRQRRIPRAPDRRDGAPRGRRRRSRPRLGRGSKEGWALPRPAKGQSPFGNPF